MKKYLRLLVLGIAFSLACILPTACDFEMLQKNLTEAKHTVTFDSCGGELTDTEQQVYAGHTITVPIPTWAGHRFLGWYLDEEYAQAFDFDNTISKDITLYANWVESHTVTFDADNGTPNIVFQVDHNGTVENVPTNLQKPNYSFHGWVYEDNTPFNPDAPITQDLSLHAVWVRVHTVTLDPCNNTDTIILEIEDNTVVENLPADPTWENHEFQGWFDNNNNEFDATEPITQNIILHAEWVEVYTVRYIDTRNGIDNVTEQTVYRGNLITNVPAPEWEGHTFSGWYLNLEDPDAEPFDFGSTLIDENKILHAKWEEIMCNVIFSSCGITTHEDFAYGSLITPPAYTLDDYEIQYWYDEFADEPEPFDFSQPITESYIRLKAKWTINIEVSLNYQTGTYKLTGFYDELDTIVLPQRYNDKLITSVGDNVFSNNCAVTTIVIPEGYTSVGRYAFSWCENLASIVFPNTCKTIDAGVLQYCSALKTVTMNCVEKIGQYAFQGCSELTDFIIPDSVTIIDNYAFYECSSLTAINIPYGVTKIGNQAFKDCSSLTTIIIPSTVQTIGANAFNRCSSLTKIYCRVADKPSGWNSNWHGGNADKVEWDYDGKYTVAFDSHGGSAVTSVEVDDGAMISAPTEPTQEGFDFDGWYLDAEYTLPFDFDTYHVSRNLTLHAKWQAMCVVTFNADGKGTTPASQRIVSGTKVTKPADSVGDADYGFIYWYADNANEPFDFDQNITQNITLTAYWTKYCEFFYQLVDDTSYKIIGYSRNLNYTDPDNVIVPRSYLGKPVTAIDRDGDRGIFESSTITKITIFDNITSIGIGAFKNCVNLTSITLPNSITAFSNSVFSGCSGLTSFTIPDSVTSIGARAFENCTGLTAIEIPGNVESIGACAFAGCTNLASVNIVYGSYAGGRQFGVKSIDGYAFQDCLSLENIYLPGTITSMNFGIFLNCNITVTVYRYSNYSSWDEMWNYAGNGSVTVIYQ